MVAINFNHKYLIAENQLNINFYSQKSEGNWGSDNTYIRVNGNWNIIYLADRKIIGWYLSENMITQNTILKVRINTRKTRNISNRFIFHSDIGVQYASNKMTNLCNFNLKITQSMNRKDLRLRIKT